MASRPSITAASVADFSSRYSSPRLISASSYSRVAASDVAAGAFDVSSLYMASAFRGSVLASFWASCSRLDGAAAMAGGSALERLVARTRRRRWLLQSKIERSVSWETELHLDGERETCASDSDEVNLCAAVSSPIPGAAPPGCHGARCSQLPADRLPFRAQSCAILLRPVVSPLLSPP